MTKDLTTGSPLKVLMGFGIPILLGNLFQQAYNMADAIIVGQFVGVEALAGVGSTGSVNFLIIGFVVGTSAGFAIPISQSFGAGDYHKVRKYFTNAIWIAGFISIALTIITLLTIEQILVLMQTPDDMFVYAKTYISTVFMGIPGIFLYNLLASVLRSIGDSRTPVIFLIGAAIVNVVLDLIFVLIFNWGVFGTGLATVISQTTAGVLCVLLINKKFDILKPEKEDWKINGAFVKKLISTGLPMGLQFSITAIGSVILQASINTLGTVYCAAITAAGKISIFAMQGLEALGLSMATYTGQNLGAKKVDRISQGVRQGLIIGAVYSTMVFAILYFASDSLSLLFVSAEDVDIIAYIGEFLLINTGMYFALALLMIFRNTIQGLGYSKYAIIIGIIEMAARILVAVILVPKLGYSGAVLSNPIAWISASIFLIPAYKNLIRKVKNEHNKKTVSTV